ncbi:carboxypeptidase regulatory-like domain-containing protein [Candidatus Fermentibacteria bacterium]|nr:MAG: carboxypeptidase regulatory-like domain-containing protein [Candidatus Fermentibacteria bacterium]
MHGNPVKILLSSAVFLMLTAPVFGHGARVVWELQGDSVHISASFDDGQPLSRAQVTVFSGAAPSVPHIVGMTDENGEFSFLPDREESLNWDVQVRSAGHGDMVHLSLTEEPAVESEQGTFSTLQVVLMSACVVLGFVGTALFFASRRKK